MKIHFAAVFSVSLGILLLSSCVGGFDTRYERIENKVRPLAMVVDTCDIHPGDTVLVTTYYAGADFDSIEWKASFNVAYNSIGTSAALDTLSLDDPSWYVPGSSSFSRDSLTGTVTASIRIIIPEDIVRISTERMGVTLAGLQSQEISRLPPEFLSLDTKTVISLLEAASKVYSTKDSSSMAMLAFTPGITYADLPIDSASIAGLLGGSDGLNAQAAALSLYQALYVIHDTVMTSTDSQGNVVLDTISGNFFQTQTAYLSRVFTAFVAVYQKTSAGTYAETYLPVRYTSMMTYNPQAQPNRNPSITRIAVYRQAEGKKFDVALGSTYDSLWFLYDSSSEILDTITITDGRSYFISATTDSTQRDLSFSANGESVVENYYFDWFYHNDVAVAGLPQDSLLLIDPSGDSTSQFIAPRDHRMNEFTVWCSAWDGMIGERNRPSGTAMVRVRGYLKYE